MKKKDALPNLLWVALAVAGLGLSLPAEALDPRLQDVNDLVYVLQPGVPGATPADIAATEFDLVVMDYSADGDEASEFTAQQIADLKATGKVVLAYLSVGEAEDYRWYWDSTWNDDPPPDPDAPAWLGPFNPSFPNNYKVRYWQAAWQGILFGTTSGPAKSYLDRIVDQGFDGIYLDIIDAFDYWSNEQPERTREQARQDMIALVQALGAYARTTRGVSNFLVFPQNGEDIVRDDSFDLDAAGLAYLAAIDGIGIEDIYYDELTPQPPAEVQFRMGVLADYLSAGGDSRLVVATDYVWNPSAPGGASNISRYNDFESRCLTAGYVPYAALRDRDLDEILEVEATGGFLFSQPKTNSGEIFSDGFESGDT
ncbi:MAG: endo alpha-1,4 polygalactosaminidase, partial [Acidobacteria bacterium]|nr:endo alpha-1,4 polygalactosaminidase [Acidobacteriota bacterium]